MFNVRSGLVLIICVLLFVSSSQAFDGNRKGFVLGGGVGFSPYAEWSWKDVGINEKKAGVGIDFLIGYAWNDRDMIVIEYNGVIINSDYFNQSAFLTFAGPVWYHYFNKEPKGFYTTLGLWRYGFSIGEEGTSSGWGYMIGGGYEFYKNIQVGLYWGGGSVKLCKNDTNKSGMNHLSMLVTIVAY
ncbi:MAG: outer membrane beta-barrel protein [candidate division Zixibacteria bacterium]|nr:outer membrane beta-barrel protein [candidate division Zixibacteria bacterium]